MSVESHTYPSGLTVHVDTIPGRSITAMNVHLPFGSVHEAPGDEGVAHALEHAVFIKTPDFKSPSAIDMHGKLNGMQFNAATGYASTTFETRGLKIAPALHHLSQVLVYAELPAAGVKSEMKSVRREAQIELDELDGLHDTAGDLAMFGHPYGRAIIGYHDKLHFTADQLRGAYRANYRLGAMTLLVVGGATIENIVTALPMYFDVDTQQPAHAANTPMQPEHRESTLTGLVQPESGSLRLSISHPLPADVRARMLANEELYSIAISVMQDKCFEVMRYENGLSYDSEVQISDYNHIAAWALRASVLTDKENRAKAIQVLDRALSKPGKSYSSKRIQGTLAMGALDVVNALESTSQMINAYTAMVDRGVPITSLNKSEKIVQSLTVADVRRAIDDVVEIAATTPRFEHRSGARKAVGDVDRVIDRSEFI